MTWDSNTSFKGGGIISADSLIIKKVHDGYIIHVKGRESHSHFAKFNGAMMLKKLLVKGILPTREYFLIATQRILTDDEIAELKVLKKKNYINKPQSSFQ